MMTTKLFLLVLFSLTLAAFSLAKPEWSLVEVEKKEGHRQQHEDKRLDEDQGVGAQGGGDYRMVIIL